MLQAQFTSSGTYQRAIIRGWAYNECICSIYMLLCSYLGMGKTGNLERLACSNGTTVLWGDEAPESARKSSSITELFWKVRYSQIAPWTDVIYCDSSSGCRKIVQVLPDGTTVHSSATGTSITLEHSAGSNASDRAHFLFEAHQVKNSMLSVERYYFDVHFTVICE